MPTAWRMQIHRHAYGTTACGTYRVHVTCDMCCVLMLRYLLGVTDEERQTRRDQVLSTTAADFKAFADVLEAVRGDAARVVAVTSADKAAAVLSERPGFWEVRKVL